MCPLELATGTAARQDTVLEKPISQPFGLRVEAGERCTDAKSTEMSAAGRCQVRRLRKPFKDPFTAREL